MTVLHEFQGNFASGEIDPTLRGQTSLKAYANGARRVRNLQRRSTGGLERRNGSYDLGTLAGNARMAEFEFSSTQRYVLAFQDQCVRIFDLNGVLLQQITAAPWNLQQAFELTYTQLGDTMILTHQTMAGIWMLKRTGATSFALLPFGFEVAIDGAKVFQPYFKFAPATAALKASAATGTVTVEASEDVFVAGHVGCRFRILDSEVLIQAVTDARHATALALGGGLIGKLDLDPFKTTAGSAQVEVLHLFHGLATGATITLAGANSVGGIAGAQLNGARTVTVVDELRYLITAGAAATTSEDGGGPNVSFSAAGTSTRSWLEPSISPVRGYPGACAFHEGRLWLAGTPSQPDGAWGSKALAPFNFDVGKGYDGDSVQGAAGSEDVSTILHLVSNGELQLMTATRESIYVTRDGEAITPNNQRVKGQSSAGTGRVQPVVFDGATLFVQENGLSVSEMAFSSAEGGYLATPVSTLAGHLIRKPTSCAASPGTTSRAEQFAFFVNGAANAKQDVPVGSVAVFHSLRAENIAGWALWTFGASGIARSVCAVGPYVFFAVERAGDVRLYRMADSDLISLDGAVHHITDTAKTSWILDARVRGRTVSIVTELGHHGDFAIPASGVLELEIPVLNVVAGDDFRFVLEPLPPVVQLPNGETTGQIKRIVRSIVDFDEAFAATVNGERVETRQAGDDFAGAVRPVTGPVEIGHLGFSRAPTIIISQAEPLPARILSVNQKVKV